jgi:hypothetical protein
MRDDERAALASNWQTIVLADAAIALAALVGGLFLVAQGRAVIGAPVAAGGLVYVVAGLRRFRRWRQLRTEHGLDR